MTFGSKYDYLDITLPRGNQLKNFPNFVAKIDFSSAGENPNFCGSRFRLLAKQEVGQIYFSLSSNSSLGMLFQRLVLLRMSDRVPFAKTL